VTLIEVPDQLRKDAMIQVTGELLPNFPFALKRSPRGYLELLKLPRGYLESFRNCPRGIWEVSEIAQGVFGKFQKLHKGYLEKLSKYVLGLLFKENLVKIPLTFNAMSGISPQRDLDFLIFEVFVADLHVNILRP